MNSPTVHAASRRRVRSTMRRASSRRTPPVTPWPMSISRRSRDALSGETPQRRFPPLLMTVGVLFLAAAVPQAPTTRAVARFGGARHIPVGGGYPGGGPGGYAYAGGGAYPGGGSKAPHSANTCDRMDQDGNWRTWIGRPNRSATTKSRYKDVIRNRRSPAGSPDGHDAAASHLPYGQCPLAASRRHGCRKTTVPASSSATDTGRRSPNS